MHRPVSPFRRLLSFAAVFVLLFSFLFSGCHQLLPPPPVSTHEPGSYVENIDALDVYYRFIYTLESAEIEKRIINANDLYGILSSTLSTVKYSRSGETVRLLYRERAPFVFFFYPAYDYYDGANYYYQYDGNWFADSTNRHAYYLTPDFLGIPVDIFSNYDITFNGLYKNGDEYILKIQGKHHETGMLCEITGKADNTLSITLLEIIEEYSSKNDRIDQRRTVIEYKNINGDIEIEPPSSLDFDEVTYFTH